MKYLVMMQDEWNNLYYMGQYQNLNDAVPDVNDWLKIYETQIDSIEEYPGTFGMVFDKEIETPNEEIVMIRGFILEEGE